MNTILVEARKDANVRPTLDAFAEACASAGHRVVRWRGPLSGRVAYSRRIPRCDLAILFNGTHCKYNRPLRKLRTIGASILFAELGWYPQKGTFQLDPQGINAGASWAGVPLEFRGETPLPVRRTGDLLLILQCDDDTQITHMSPWFAEMYAFVKHVCRHSCLPVRVRPHPCCPPDPRIAELVGRFRCQWDRSPSLADALEPSRAVACVNSSSAVEALAHKLPVLCYGRAIYRHRGAVYCLRRDGTRTHAVTRALAAGQCGLFEEAVDAVLSRIERNQWTLAEIPDRFPPVLEAMLGGDEKSATSRTEACRPAAWPFGAYAAVFGARPDRRASTRKVA